MHFRNIILATTKAGLSRQRMTWNYGMNVHMRYYYTAIKLETVKSGFRPQLHAVVCGEVAAPLRHHSTTAEVPETRYSQ